MSTFSETGFTKKLAELNPSQQSIQTLSLWLIHHRKHAKPIVEVWMKELKKVKPPKRLTFLYLANDVIQNSKKKGPEFNKMFRCVLADAYKVAIKEADDKTKGSMERMVNIWDERGVFDKETIGNINKAIVAVSSKRKESSESIEDKEKASSAKFAATETNRQRLSKESYKAKEYKKGKEAKKKKKGEMTLQEEIELEVKNGASAESPEAAQLVKALHDLENSASSDAAVRERIAALPPEVSDVSRLNRIQDHKSADELAVTVNDACEMLTAYNGRLAEELQERRRVAKMLKEYILAQKEAMNEDERKLKEYKGKLDKVSTVRKELKSHIQSLPDLDLLPQVTGGLPPLPSAGDLFAKDMS